MIASFLEFTGINYRKSFGGLVESHDKFVEHDGRFGVPVAFESKGETASVEEDIYMEFELLRTQVGFDPSGQARGRLVTALLSICDQ